MGQLVATSAGTWKANCMHITVLAAAAIAKCSEARAYVGYYHYSIPTPNCSAAAM